jgi:hypothetical protein
MDVMAPISDFRHCGFVQYIAKLVKILLEASNFVWPCTEQSGRHSEWQTPMSYLTRGIGHVARGLRVTNHVEARGSSACDGRSLALLSRVHSTSLKSCYLEVSLMNKTALGRNVYLLWMRSTHTPGP